VLIIDDVQWLDDSSAELIIRLAEEFPRGGDAPLLLAFAGRDPDLAARLKIPYALVEVRKLTLEEKTSLLIKGIGLDPAVAERIVLNFGALPSEKGELYWLLENVRHLANLGAFIKGPASWLWNPDFLQTHHDSLPVPGHYKQLLKERLNEHPQYRWILECAACIGLEFDVRILSQSLSLSRLELLKVLQEIEDTTGLVNDVRESDDLYVFSSSFLLETLREELEVRFDGPKSKKIPQIIREFHARIAQAQEEMLTESPTFVFSVAKHYYAAGLLHVKKAIHYCRAAAEAAVRLFQFSDARTYLSMAEECAQAAGMPDIFLTEKTIIALHEAHVTGAQRTEAVSAALLLIQQSPDASPGLLLLAARAFYDARDFANTLGAAERTLAAPGLSALERAEALQFKSLSLPAGQKAERIDGLSEALDVLGKSKHDTPAAKMLKARILNSLAETMSYGAEEEQRQALGYFRRSIQIKDRRETHDLPGLARSHGGLARLRYRLGNLEEALESIQKDLEISIQLGDLSGQSQMHSLTGRIHLDRKDYPAALRHYKEALSLARRGQSHKDAFYALVGLVEYGCLDKSYSLLTEAARDLEEHISSHGVANADILKKVLDICLEHRDASWHGSLRRVLEKQVHAD
jgi:tetratricopeptide (TPR) repeat protein